MTAHRYRLRPVAVAPRALSHPLRLPVYSVSGSPTTITVAPISALFVPPVVWAIATLYVPLVAPWLQPGARWGVAIAAAILVAISLLGHNLAHLGMARLLRGACPMRLPLTLFGDAAQVWPFARTPGHDALIAVSGPGFNLGVALSMYVLWERDLYVYATIALPLVVGANLVLAVVNLTPGFPVDGGRIVRATMWGLLGRPALGLRLAQWSGYAVVGLIGLWGSWLLAIVAPFSRWFGWGTIGVALLLGLVAWTHRGWHGAVPTTYPRRLVSLRGAMVFPVVLGLLALASSLLPVPMGIRMPGVAAPIEPMVRIIPGPRAPTRGSFLMTTVVEQTPIVLAQWIYGQLSASSDLVPPVKVLPPHSTVRARMQQQYAVLQDSTQTAALLAVWLASDQRLQARPGVEVIAVPPHSAAWGSLQPGDRLLRLNGRWLQNGADLMTALGSDASARAVQLDVLRNNRLLYLQVEQPRRADGAAFSLPTIRPAPPNGGEPVWVQITPRNIMGGPSAGLMFTLAAYDALIPEDLSGGRRIAGTGTVDAGGQVGAIGGVVQKVAAAEAAGADYFLVPVANAAEARQAAQHVTVVEVASVQQAIAILRMLPPLASQP